MPASRDAGPAGHGGLRRDRHRPRGRASRPAGPEVFRLHCPRERGRGRGRAPARGRAPRPRASSSGRARKASEDLGNDLAAIFDAHVLLLSDAKFLGRVEERIRSQQVNAEWAVHKTAEELDDRFAHMDDAYLRERSEDLTDVSRHLLRSLQGIAHHELSGAAGRTSSSWPTTSPPPTPSGWAASA